MMTQKSEQKIDMDLDAFFDAAKDQDAIPNASFMERVMADAALETQTRVKRVAQTQPWWVDVLNSFGGWKAICTLTACACFGIYLGYANPENINYINGAQTTVEIFDTDSFSVAYDIETLFQEG
ncbi:hypothetical protein F9L33_01005 [Amylibacter sp. SFDW26]|uniref:hypothetical protein n=1 Tax=Amylibacter sp. SFDW26 TaxID=2652722 RepID=UPI001321123F|nr:hypothetical protein [Amylibacter sp. SFDW26]KAB7615377.1 hypothetical protein F9L33_01005 [Amylibacter sp. SFDW26]